MTDAVKVALITNATVILVAILSRLWSHREHKKTERTANRTEGKINTLLNGSYHDKGWNLAGKTNIENEEGHARLDVPDRRNLHLDLSRDASHGDGTINKSPVGDQANLDDCWMQNLNANAARRHAQHAGRRNGVSGNLQEIVLEHEETQPDAPFPFLEVALRKAKDSPFVVIGIMISIAAIIVGAVMSLTVGFGIFLFNMNGTMHEVKAQQTIILDQMAKMQGDIDNTGNVMRSYEAANGKRSEFQIGLMTRDQQQAMNDYDQSHPLPKMPAQRN